MNILHVLRTFYTDGINEKLYFLAQETYACLHVHASPLVVSVRASVHTERAHTSENI